MHQVETLGFGILSCGEGDRRSIIHQDVNAAKSLNCPIYRILYLILIPYVTLHCQRLPSCNNHFLRRAVNRSSQFWIFFHRFPKHHNIRTLRSQSESDSLANSPARTRNQHSFVFQRHTIEVLKLKIPKLVIATPKSPYIYDSDGNSCKSIIANICSIDKEM